jgi:hypothetical protein
LRSVREHAHHSATECLVRNRACDDARRIYKTGETERMGSKARPADLDRLDASFESSHRECKR